MTILITTPSGPSHASLRCASCGAPARLAGDGYWLLDGAPYHAPCAPWAGRPFPFAWAADEGRRLLGRARRAGAEPSPKLVRAVSFLHDAARTWAPAEPAAVLERAGLAAALVEHWKVRCKRAAAPGPGGR